MATLGLVYRYVVSMAKTFMGRFERDFVLRSATLRLDSGDEEITAEMCAALAVAGNTDGSLVSLDPIFDRLDGADWGVILCTYTYKSTGPYSYYLSERNPSFPPKCLLDIIGGSNKAASAIVSPDKMIILAERGEDGDDVTEQMLPFLGPDGTFHGMVDFERDDWSFFDLRSVFPDIVDGEDVVLTFADGHSTTLTYTQNTGEEEENL